MITKVIHSTFELELSNDEITHVEENNWLNDKVQAKYTYPIEKDLTPEQIVAFKNITDYNLESYDSLFEVDFYTMGERHDAVLEIERMIGKRAYFQISYGLEEFPNFSKKLSELPLEIVNLGLSIFEYAESIITQTWPAVNFNFPQVITDKFDTETDQWAYFEGLVNKYVGSSFLINEYDAENDIQINRNIIQPLPYLLHVLTKGFEDAGYTLEGEILNDPELKMATIYTLSEFYTNFSEVSEIYNINTDDYYELVGSRGSYSLDIVLPSPGRYKIAGNVIVRANSNAQVYSGSVNMSYNGNPFWWANINSANNGYQESFHSLDVNFDYTGVEGPLNIFSVQLNYGITNGDIIDDAMICDLTLTRLTQLDSEGNTLPSLVIPDVIDLTKCVPDINFGDLVNAIAKMKNYGINIDGLVVTMSKKRALIDSNDEAFYLVPFEVQYPERNFNQGKSFTFGFFEIDSDEYEFPSLLINNDGFTSSPYTKPEDAEEIIINALPLPRKQKGSVLTAHGFLDDNSKTQLVLYSGLLGGVNLARNPEPLSILNLYLNHHQDWFDFLLKSIRFVWSFSAFHEEMLKLKIKSIVYAYGQFHIIRRLTRKQISDETISAEIETESLI
ncbi:hypothetical protein [Sediminibacter sp. Hel_I_10]|uniref:hypothetical protein n=1 Tax=Sediminibacter sp. Hel_I_10 TaxID=1392490 RepID=UPI000479BE78|nr:hypothetical protein [Sediminibacter sp. Hel_I_10]